MASAVPEQPAGLAAEAASLISYLELAPSLSKASLLGATGDVLLQCSQRSVEENKQRTFCSVFSLSPGRAPPFGFEARGASLVVPSPSGRKLLVIRNPASDKDATLFELWENGRLASELAVPATTHGGVYADGGILEGVAWSGDEGRVAFAAEAPPAERTPSWGGRGEGDAKNGWRGVGAHVEDWGEQAGGRKRASLFVLSISVTRAAPPRTRVTTLSVAAVGGCPADASCGARPFVCSFFCSSFLLHTPRASCVLSRSPHRRRARVGPMRRPCFGVRRRVARLRFAQNPTQARPRVLPEPGVGALRRGRAGARCSRLRGRRGEGRSAAGSRAEAYAHVRVRVFAALPPVRRAPRVPVGRRRGGHRLARGDAVAAFASLWLCWFRLF